MIDEHAPDCPKCGTDRTWFRFKNQGECRECGLIWNVVRDRAINRVIFALRAAGVRGPFDHDLTERQVAQMLVDEALGVSVVRT